MAAPTTATATSSGCWAAPSRAAAFMATGPASTPAQLYQQRDLAVTTDFRTALAAILERHMRLGDRQLEAVLPGAPPAPPELAQMLPA